MNRVESGETKRQAYLQAAEGMYERLVAWRAAHPAASFDEIAEAVGQERRGLMGELLADLVTQPAAAVEAGATNCPTCGAASEDKGQQQRLVSHREGEVKLKRGYRYCTACGSGFFPPGPPTTTDTPDLESCDHPTGGALGG
ncbi:MAG: hypothetical protein ACREMY_33745 [bacterium]